MNGKANIVQKCVLVPVEKYKKLIEKQMTGTVNHNPSNQNSASGSAAGLAAAAARSGGFSAVDRAAGAAEIESDSISEHLNYSTGNRLFRHSLIGTGVRGEREANRGGETTTKPPPPPGESDLEVELRDNLGWSKYWQPISQFI